jgi:hypothetical protein
MQRDWRYTDNIPRAGVSRGAPQQQEWANLRPARSQAETQGGKLRCPRAALEPGSRASLSAGMTGTQRLSCRNCAKGNIRGPRLIHSDRCGSRSGPDSRGRRRGVGWGLPRPEVPQNRVQRRDRAFWRPAPRDPKGLLGSGNEPRSAQSWRSTISFLVSAMALAGLRPLGQALVQFRIVWQR